MKVTAARARRLFCLMLCLSITAALAACGSDSGSGATVATDEYAFTLPAGWRQLQGQELDRAGQALLGTSSSQNPGQRISLSSAAVADDQTQGFQSSVNVTREPLPAGTSLKEYIRASVRNLGAVVQNPHLVGTPRRTDLGGTPAGALDYSGIQQGRQVNFVDVTAVRNGVAYNFTLTALPDHVAGVGADFRSMLHSWEWKS